MNCKNETKETNYSGLICLAIVSIIIWAALIVGKVTGVILWSWKAVILAALWIPFLSLSLFLTAAGVFILIGRTQKRIREWKRRRKISRTLWEAMDGMTLNSIGPIYGVRRQQGEKNRDYKRRILKAARTVDTVNVQSPPKPATGHNLDKIASKHGLSRRPHETDTQLQSRIRAAVMKALEGGKQNGL